MYALSTIVQQHASIRHFFDVTTDDNLTMILHEFLPFIEIKQVPSSSANYDLEAFFKQELSTYHLMIHLYSKLNCFSSLMLHIYY